MGMENGAPIEEPSDSFRRSSTHPERKSGLRTWDLRQVPHGWSLALLGEKAIRPTGYGFLAGHRYLICDRDAKFTAHSGFFSRLRGCR